MDLFRNVVSLEYQAQSAFDAHLYHNASLLHSRAIAITPHLCQPRLAGVLCYRLGDSLKAQHSILDATAVYEAGFQALAAPGRLDVQHLLVSLQAIGPHFYRFDRLTMPDHDDLATAEALHSAMADQMLPARMLIECAELYERQSSMYLALHSYKRARATLAAPLDLRVSILVRMGSLAQRQGELVTAEEALDALLDLRNSTTNLESLAHILPALGTLYEAIGNGQEALRMCRQALKVCLSLNDSVAIGYARGQLTRLSIRLYQSKRDLDSAHNPSAAQEQMHGFLPLRREPQVLEEIVGRRTVGDPVPVDRSDR